MVVYNLYGIIELINSRETMKKSELIDQLAIEYPHLYHRDIEKVVDVFL